MKRERLWKKTLPQWAMKMKSHKHNTQHPATGGKFEGKIKNFHHLLLYEHWKIENIFPHLDDG